MRAHLAHPYWLDHFGVRGRRYITEDTGHLFDRLLAFGESVLADYGRWLQRLLTRYALCTRQSMHFMTESIEVHLPLRACVRASGPARGRSGGDALPTTRR